MGIWGAGAFTVAAVAMVVSRFLRQRERDAEAAARPPNRYQRIGARLVLRRGKRPPKPPRRSPSGAATGVAVASFAIGCGILFTHVKDAQVPEQRGVGVLTSIKSRSARNFRPLAPGAGRGLALSMAVHFNGCGTPWHAKRVHVTLFASGTTEYWIDNDKRLTTGVARVELAIPDRGISKIKVGLGFDGKIAARAPFEDGLDDEHSPSFQQLRTRRTPGFTIVGIDIPAWGTHIRPVAVSFDADWLSSRAVLRSCFLRLPALAGFPTVLSARAIDGSVTTPDNVDAVPPPRSIFVVSSKQPNLATFYAPQYETNVGITSLDLGSHALRDDLSRPGSNADPGGTPSWECSTKDPNPTVESPNFVPERRPDIFQLDPDASGKIVLTGAWRAGRLGKAITEDTCATYAVIEGANDAIPDNVVGLLVGALFSFGISLLHTSLRPEKEAPEGEHEYGEKRRRT